jgi:DNA-binding SARP family transcriptional activator
VPTTDRCATGGGCVHLLSAFTCRIDGGEVALAELPRNLVINLVLADHRMSRGALMARLWPDEEPERAAKRLRQTLWRIRRLTRGRIVTADHEVVGLAEDACVDFTAALGLARFAVSATAELPELAARPLDHWRSLGRPLLAGATSGEVHTAQQRWDRLRLLALERVAEAMLFRGDIPAAIELASYAVEVDDLSEGPYRVLALAHLARNDIGMAQRVYGAYAALLRENLGIGPSAEFGDILNTAGSRRLAG